MKEPYEGAIAVTDPKLKQLIKIIELKDEIHWIEDAISGLIRSEQAAVNDEMYERASLILMERGKMIRRKKRLEKQLEKI